MIQPTYYVRHLDGSYTEADPQPVQQMVVTEFIPGTSKELNAIHAVIMNIGGDWPEVPGDTYTLYHVKRMARSFRAASLGPQTEQTETCVWTPMDDDTGSWESACGEAWSFIEDGPVENNVRFCHGCGKPVEIKE